MAKITRQILKLFGSTGPTADFGKFGSLAAGAAFETKDIATIQSLAAWLTGLRACLLTQKAPPLQDVNAVLYVFATQLCYLFQEGIPEWETGTTYFIGSIVKKAGTLEFYGSLVDNNTGNALPTQTTNANWAYLGLQTDLPLIRTNVRPVNVNGGFEIWQRGNTFNGIGASAYSADRWQAIFDGAPTLNVTREGVTIHSGTYSAKANLTAVGGATKALLQQPIEKYVEYAGRAVSLSMWVNTTRSNIKIGISDGVKLTKSAAHPGDGAWHMLTVDNFVVDGTPTELKVQVGQLDGVIGTGIFYADDAMLTLGIASVPYIPEDPQQAMARCQRYYETLSTIPVGLLVATSGGRLFIGAGFRVEKAIVPTISTSGLSVLDNGSNPDTVNWAVASATGTTDRASCEIQRTPAPAVGSAFNAGITIAAEANP